MSDNTDLAERVNRLEQRVGYLERETGHDFDEYRFKRKVESVTSDDHTLSFKDGNLGGNVVVVGGVTPEQVRHLGHKLEKHDLEWEVSEAHPREVSLRVTDNVLHFH